MRSEHFFLSSLERLYSKSVCERDPSRAFSHFMRISLCLSVLSSIHYALNLSVSLFRLALLRFNESVFPFFFSAVFLYMRSKRSVWLLLGNSSSMHPTISQIQLVWAAFMLLLVLVLEPPPLPSLWLSMSMALTLTLTYENHAFSHECSCAAAVAVIIKYYIVFAWLVFLRLLRVWMCVCAMCIFAVVLLLTMWNLHCIFLCLSLSNTRSFSHLIYSTALLLIHCNLLMGYF